MGSEILKIGYEPNILEYKWVYNLRQACTKDKDYPLDWYRMTAIAILLSDGDPHLRVIDWDYLYDKLGPDNPIAVPEYDEEERPSINLIDRATSWGLFQIKGEEAHKHNYTGSIIGLCSVDANIKIACQKIYEALESVEERINKIELSGGDPFEAQQLQESLPGIAEKMAFGVDPYHVEELAKKFQRRHRDEIDALNSLYE